MPILKNQLLKVEIKPKGAELCSVKSIKHDTEFIWQANPDIWGSHAPNLFPIIGAMKNNTYFYKNREYSMPKHGFVRHNEDIELVIETESKLTFKLKTNEKLKAIYPFDFEFSITYELKGNQLFIHHNVENLGNETMYFSLGGHPAFNCPLFENEDYTDYVLEFENEETAESYLLNLETGLVTDKTKAVFDSPNSINLRKDLFNEDALIFKHITSRKVALKHKSKDEILNVKFDGFPYLGIWAKPNAPYVCIEPWIGIADAENSNQNIEDKEGIITLDAKNSFEATYSIEVNKALLN